MKERLTKHRIVRFIGFSQRNANENYIADIYEKLMKLEDIEEELGIDLITLFKALKNGIYVKNGKLDEEYFIEGIELVCDRHGLTYKWGDTKWYECYDLYGKTWALTREELL